MQQQHDRRVGRTGFTVEDVYSVDFVGPMMKPRGHEEPPRDVLDRQLPSKYLLT